MSSSVGESRELEAPSEGAATLKQLWRALIGAAGWTLALLAIVWLLWLRGGASGEATRPVWWKGLVTLGGFLAATYVLRVARRLDDRARPGWTWFDGALTAAGVAMCGVLLLRSSIPAGMLLVIAFFAIEGLSLWRLGLAPAAKIAALWRRLRSRSKTSASEVEGTPREAVNSLNVYVEEEAAEDEEAVSQQFTRREVDGGVEISGFARGRFAAGEALSNVDLAFCPTLPSQPELEYELLCEGDVDVSVASVRTYGARLELKRRGDLSQPLAYTLELHVACGAELEEESEGEAEEA